MRVILVRSILERRDVTGIFPELLDFEQQSHEFCHVLRRADAVISFPLAWFDRYTRQDDSP